MKLRRCILLGMGILAICLIGMILLAAQFILVNNYRLIEEQDAKTHMQRVIDTLQNDIDTFNIGDINWAAPPEPRTAPNNQRQNNNVDVGLVEKIGFDTGSNVTLLIDRQNNIIFRNVMEADSGKVLSTIPATLLDSLQPDSPFVSSRNLQRTIKGLITLPEGPLMMISMPLPAGSGRIIWGRYLDETEIQRLSENTKLDIRLLPYTDRNTPADFQRAKVSLATSDGLYIEPTNDQTLSSYTLINDVFGDPSVILRIQMPRTIYQQGQNGTTTFALVLILGVLGVVAGSYLLLEQSVLSPLAALNSNLGLTTAASTQKPTSGQYEIDEFNKLANHIQELTRARAAIGLKLHEAQDKFESRVNERTSELFTINAGLQQQLDVTKQAQTVLSESRDRALEGLRLRSQLLANVSHDARTPLTIIGLNTEMLQQGRHGDLNAKQNEVLNRILIATRQLINFVTNMLGEAQLVNGKMQFVKVVFEPKLLIEDLVSMLAPLAECKGIQLKSEVDLAIPSQLMGDPERLKQVIINLCENAIKFTQVGEVVVKGIRKDQHNWVIQVKDTGRGIPIEAQNRIFEAYWQLESTMVPNANRGVGLGLSIVKQIVQMMNGTITVESQPDIGTTFTVTIPIEHAPEIGLREPVLQSDKLVV